MGFEIGENVAFEEDGILVTGEIISFPKTNTVEIDKDEGFGGGVSIVDITEIFYW